jgi:adenosylmethionine-8-amino-7-oxononanoate aminotransferase
MSTTFSKLVRSAILFALTCAVTLSGVSAAQAQLSSAQQAQLRRQQQQYQQQLQQRARQQQQQQQRVQQYRQRAARALLKRRYDAQKKYVDARRKKAGEISKKYKDAGTSIGAERQKAYVRGLSPSAKRAYDIKQSRLKRIAGIKAKRDGRISDRKKDDSKKGDSGSGLKLD